MHFVMVCNDEPFVSVAKSMTYGKVLRATIMFFLRLRGGYHCNVHTRNHKIPWQIVLYRLTYYPILSERNPSVWRVGICGGKIL